MRVFVMVDAEGLSGIYRHEQVTQGSEQYAELGTLMAREINACAEGLKAGGAEWVVVRDAHGTGANVRWELLSPAVDRMVIGRSSAERFPELSGCDAVVLLGYHAMAGTDGAILEHTWSSSGVQNFWINGVKSGEIALEAAIVGEHGKPVIMVSGDDKACLEANAFVPWAVTAEVKKGLCVNGGVMLPPGAAYTLIRERAAEAVRRFEAAKIYEVQKPVVMRVELVERNFPPNVDGASYYKRLDARTYEVVADSVEQALRWALG